MNMNNSTEIHHNWRKPAPSFHAAPPVKFLFSQWWRTYALHSLCHFSALILDKHSTSQFADCQFFFLPTLCPHLSKKTRVPKSCLFWWTTYMNGGQWRETWCFLSSVQIVAPWDPQRGLNFGFSCIAVHFEMLDTTRHKTPYVCVWPLYRDTCHNSSSDLRPKQLICPLVVACRMRHNPLTLPC